MLLNIFPASNVKYKNMKKQLSLYLIVFCELKASTVEAQANL